MKDNPAISLIGGLLITAVIFAVLYLLYFLWTFDLVGGETLEEIESQRTVLLLLTIIIVGLTIFVCRHFFRTGKKYTAIGTGIFSLLALIVVTVYYLDNYHYHTTFDKTTWHQEKWKPFDMTATLVKENKLIGMTRTQVKKLLGQGFEEDDVFILYLVKQDWTLTVFFENEIAVDVKLRLPRMMT